MKICLDHVSAFNNCSGWKALVCPVATYGCETWTLKTKRRSKDQDVRDEMTKTDSAFIMDREKNE